jgi:ComF family protein
LNPFSTLLDILTESRCVSCESTEPENYDALCSRCWRELPWWRQVDGCPRCGSRLLVHPGFEGCPGCLSEGSALHRCYALTRYEGDLRRWIPGFKNAKGPFGPGTAIRLVIDGLARDFGRQIAKQTNARPDLIVSIPLHPRRQRQRGFNHVDPIAYRIAMTLDLPWASDALERIHDTRSQARLIGHRRRENLRNAFRGRASLAGAAQVWLVDDVLTTGNTLDAAANALLEAGCIEVRALTLAATLPVRRASHKEATVHAPALGDRINHSRSSIP